MRLIILLLLTIIVGCNNQTTPETLYSVDMYIGDSIHHFKNVRESDINIYQMDNNQINSARYSDINIYSIYRNGKEYKSSNIVVY